MTDMFSLHPIDSTPAAIAAAIARCGAAGREVLAEIEQLKSQRIELLMADEPLPLEANLAALASAMVNATRVSEQLDKLQRQARPAAGAAAQPDVQAKALEAAAALASWWAEHGAVVLGGVQLALTAMTSIAVAAKASQPGSASNVVPITR